jgi:maltooligosyltrehalose synthase
MTYQQRCDYAEAATNLRMIADMLTGGDYRPAAITGARQHALAAARHLDAALIADRPEERNELAGT